VPQRTFDIVNAMLSRGSGDVIDRRGVGSMQSTKGPSIQVTLNGGELGSAIHAAPILGRVQ